MTTAQIRAIRYLRAGMATGAEVQHTRADGSIIVKTSYGLKLISVCGRRFNDQNI